MEVGQAVTIVKELTLPEAAAVGSRGDPQTPGRADLSMFAHQAETALPVSLSALHSQRPSGGKHSEILGCPEGRC